MELTIKEIQNIETEMLKEISEICNRNNIKYYLAYGSVIGAVRHGGPIPWDADADICIPYNKLEKFISVVRKELSNKFFLDYHDINKYYTPTFPRVGLKGYSTFLVHVDVFMMCGLPEDSERQRGFFSKLTKLRKRHYYKIASTKYQGKRTFKSKIKHLLSKILCTPYSINKVRQQFYQLCAQYPIDKSIYVTNPSGGYGEKEFIPKKYYDEGTLFTYSNMKINIPKEYDKYLKHFYGDYMQLPPKREQRVKDIYQINKLEI